jgi:hypothetical protein
LGISRLKEALKPAIREIHPAKIPQSKDCHNRDELKRKMNSCVKVIHNGFAFAFLKVYICIRGKSEKAFPFSFTQIERKRKHKEKASKTTDFIMYSASFLLIKQVMLQANLIGNRLQNE